MFSLVPLLIIIIIIAGLAFGEKVAERQVVGQLELLVGEAGGRAVITLLGSIRTPKADIGTTIIGVVGLLLGASALFNHLKDSLNTIWEVLPKQGRGPWRFVINRFLAVVMVLGVGVIALLGFMINISIAEFRTLLADVLPGIPPGYVIRSGQLLTSFAVVTLLVALTYKLLPDTTIAWRDVWVGAALTALLLIASQLLIGVYLRSGLVGTAYSAVGAMVIILIWVYYSALIFFFGAEFTWVYANRYGSRIVPTERAVAFTPLDRAAQGILRPTEATAMAQEQDQTT